MTITKEEFEKYEKAQISSISNMVDIHDIEVKSGLSQDKIFEIMKNYDSLFKKCLISMM